MTKTVKSSKPSLYPVVRLSSTRLLDAGVVLEVIEGVDGVEVQLSGNAPMPDSVHEAVATLVRDCGLNDMDYEEIMADVARRTIWSAMRESIM